MLRRRNEEEYNPVFGCEFVCDNCGSVWNLYFEKGVEIIQEGEGAIQKMEKKEKDILCPNCDSERTTINERYPVEKKQEIQQPQIIPQQQMMQQQFQPPQNFSYPQKFENEGYQSEEPVESKNEEREKIKRIITKRQGR